MVYKLRIIFKRTRRVAVLIVGLATAAEAVSAHLLRAARLREGVCGAWAPSHWSGRRCVCSCRLVVLKLDENESPRSRSNSSSSGNKSTRTRMTTRKGVRNPDG